MATSIESAKASQSRKAVIVGIGGCSSSGKTTLSRILRDILPNTSILHEDDFYKSDHEYVSSLSFAFSASIFFTNELSVDCFCFVCYVSRMPACELAGSIFLVHFSQEML